ncbi:hypothetical protein [Leucobacter coleopterorum]|uniref:hypothetical protein n=1 Tax=Leucobacter coleopterorum TaxID=2714933 RepID=UPI001FCAB684|nr:hypothetical protein [Leucobacter coleopterorum]
MAHIPDASHTHGKRVSTPVTAQHPLDPLNEAEITKVRSILDSAGYLTEHVRVAMLLPLDPPKSAVTSWRPGDTFERRAVVTLLDRSTAEHAEVRVSISNSSVDDYRVLATTEEPYGQAAILMEEFIEVGEIVKASPSGAQLWIAADFLTLLTAASAPRSLRATSAKTTRRIVVSCAHSPT